MPIIFAGSKLLSFFFASAIAAVTGY